MNRAWVTVQEWEGRTVGQIERISEVEEWPIYCVNNGWVIPVDFDSSDIHPDYAMATLVDGVWVISEDTARKRRDENQRLKDKWLQVSEMKMECGNKVLSYFNLPFVRSFVEDDPAQYFQLPDVQRLRNFLLYGYLEDARQLLKDISQDEILPLELTDLMLERLDCYISQIDQILV